MQKSFVRLLGDHHYNVKEPKKPIKVVEDYQVILFYNLMNFGRKSQKSIGHY
jgi:hypothetical protein